MKNAPIQTANEGAGGTVNSITSKCVAITEAQIEKYDLPTKPRKAGDKRSQHIKSTVEAEAMPARIMRRLLRDSIEAFLPDNALEIAKVAEDSERAGLMALAAQMTGEGLGYGEA